MTTVLYITGFGHSGSTLLDIMLSNHPDVVGVGELAKLHRSGWTNGADRRCACGLPINDCVFWRAVRGAWLDEVGSNGIARYCALQEQYQRYRPLTRLRWIRRERAAPSAAFRNYLGMTAALYDTIRQVSSRNIIIDSSKSPLRAYALLQVPEIDVHVVHLVRDGRGVVWSRTKPKQRSKDPDAGIPRDFSAAPAWRTALEWAAANVQGEWVTRQAPPDRALRITYEALCTQPEAVLAQIGHLLEVDMSAVAELVGGQRPLHVGHQVAGNSIRMADEIIFRPDTQWQQRLPQRDRLVFWSMAGWLARHYGYT